MAGVDESDEGGVGSCGTGIASVVFPLIIFGVFDLLFKEVTDDEEDEDDLACGQWGRANCSILNGLFRGGQDWGAKGEDDVIWTRGRLISLWMWWWIRWWLWLWLWW